MVTECICQVAEAALTRFRFLLWLRYQILTELYRFWSASVVWKKNSSIIWYSKSHPLCTVRFETHMISTHQDTGVPSSSNASFWSFSEKDSTSCSGSLMCFVTSSAVFPRVYNGIMQYVTFWGWLLLFNIMRTWDRPYFVVRITFIAGGSIPLYGCIPVLRPTHKIIQVVCSFDNYAWDCINDILHTCMCVPILMCFLHGLKKTLVPRGVFNLTMEP